MDKLEKITADLQAKKKEWTVKRDQSTTTPLRDMYQGRVEGIHYALGVLEGLRADEI